MGEDYLWLVFARSTISYALAVHISCARRVVDAYAALVTLLVVAQDVGNVKGYHRLKA